MSKSILINVLPLLAIVFIAIYSHPSASLKSDKDKPIQLSSNTAVRNEKEGVTTYSGNVLLKQGTLTIKADLLMVFHDSGRAHKIIAQGSPVELQQKPSIDQATIKAKALEMIYYRESNKIVLNNDAEIKQAKSIIQGDKIIYSILEERVVAESIANKNGERVNVILPSDLINER